MKKTGISKKLLSILLAVALAMSLAPAAAFASAAAPGEKALLDGDVVDPDPDSDLPYEIIFDESEKNIDLFYYYVYYFPSEYSQNDKVTIRDTATGEEVEYTYKFNDFYDSDWKTMKEHGYAMSYLWAGNYTLDMLTDDNGGKYDFFYFLYEVNEDGQPVDKDGTPLDNPRDPNVSLLGLSDVYTVQSITDKIEKTVSGVSYMVFADRADHAEAILSDPGKVPKKLTIPAKITIGGKSYPVTLIDYTCFSGAAQMTSVTIPNTMTVIRDSAFANTGLKKVSIPSSVEDIGETAFGYVITQDAETMDYDVKKVPGFTIYAKSASVGAQYAHDNGFRLITEVTAKKMRASLKAKALKKRKVRLTWKKQPYATGYQIYKANKKKGKFKRVATIKSAATTKWTSKSCSKKLKGKRLYYKIRPYTVIDGKTYYGKWSAVKRVRIRK